MCLSLISGYTFKCPTHTSSRFVNAGRLLRNNQRSVGQSEINDSGIMRDLFPRRRQNVFARDLPECVQGRLDRGATGSQSRRLYLMYASPEKLIREILHEE